MFAPHAPRYANSPALTPESNPTGILGRIKDNQHLRKIKGLKEFKIRFHVKEDKPEVMILKTTSEGTTNTFGMVEDVLRAELIK
jgi:hypothetical protein